MLRFLKEPFSGFSHLLAALAAVGGALLLVASSPPDRGQQAALVVYGGSMVLMFLASAAYHLIDASPNVVRRLRKLDHSAVYLLIAGTHTPLAFVLLSDGWRWGILLPIWALALVGIGVKAFMALGPRGLSTVLYLVMGWLGVFPAIQLYQILPLGALGWLLLGGLFYSAGAIVYVRKRPNPFPNVLGFHGIWHLFVIGGSLCHYLLILWYVAPFERMV